MQLTDFLYGLIDEGVVSVAGEVTPFDETDNELAVEILKQYYARDIVDMPYTPPAFNATAALWGAQYIYLCTQLTVLRQLGEEEVKNYLKGYEENLSPEVVYSADLMLRFLPQLFNLAKGLAPADILVTIMQNTATNWPFSSVGIEVTETFNTAIIFQHPTLKYSYADRIITHKDLKRALLDDEIKNTITEVLGAHTTTLWPQFVSE